MNTRDGRGIDCGQTTLGRVFIGYGDDARTAVGDTFAEPGWGEGVVVVVADRNAK